MIIKLKTKTEIMWIILAFCLIRFFVLGREMFFLFSFLPIGIYFIRKGAIVIPKIPGFIAYVAVLLLATTIGLSKYPVQLVERDVFYQFFDILFLLIGYYSFDYYKDKNKSMWKTLCLYLFIISVWCLLKGTVSITGGATFNEFRDLFKDEVLNISIFLPLLIGKRIIYKEITFSKTKDNIIIGTWLIQMLLDLSRTAIINSIIGTVVFFICATISRREELKSYLKTAMMIAMVVVFSATVILIMPDDITDVLGDKFENTFSEINAETKFRNSSEAQADWRGYETQCAQKQWLNSNPLEQIIGSGNGTLISIKYFPEQWKSFQERQNGKTGITILHNTYYTLLIKGGVISVIAIMWLFIGNILNAIKQLRRKSTETDFFAIAQIVMFCVLMIDTYVVQSMMCYGAEIASLLLASWICARFLYRSPDVEKACMS